MKSQPPLRRAAFTLIEVLTVIAIIAMLAALGFAGLRYAMAKSREKETVNFIGDVSKSIEEYRQERGNYPRPADPEEETTTDGQSYRVGPAKMLYQVLSGDGTDAIKGGDNKIPNGQQGSAIDPKDPNGPGKIYMDTVVAPSEQQIKDKKKSKWVETSGESAYYLIDPWRHPMQYQVPEVDKNGIIANSAKLHGGSSLFELWSYGTLKLPDESEEGKKEWITNWQK
jgi:prepilin-type N-terminal cleavage/methylation domain-containing protein